MARTRKADRSSSARAVGFDPAALDELIGDAKTAEDVELLFRQMKKVLMERILSGKLTHLGKGAKGNGERAPFEERV